MLSTYGDAARAFNVSLPSAVVRTEAFPGFFTLYGQDWHLVVFCHWWLFYLDSLIVDGDSLDDFGTGSVVDSLIGREAIRFEYATARPDVAVLQFGDGVGLAMETDSDYEPWSLYTSRGAFTAALSDFRQT